MEQALKLVKKETLRKPHWVVRFLKQGYSVEEIASTLEMEIEEVKEVQDTITPVKPLKAYNGVNNTYANVCKNCGTTIPLHASHCICCGN